MLIVRLESCAPEGSEMEIKETVAMILERFGTVRVQEIDRKNNLFFLTLHVSAPEGSGPSVGGTLDAQLRKYGDVRILSIKEELPRQMNFVTMMQ